MKKLFLTLLFVICLCSQAWGANWTISSGATLINGSDTSTWTEEGEGSVSAGDTLTFASGGSWTSCISIRNLEGTAENPIVIQNYSGEQAVINVTTATKEYAALYFYYGAPSTYVTINGNNNPPGTYGIKITGTRSGGELAMDRAISYGGSDQSFSDGDWEGMKIQYVHVDGGENSNIENGVHFPKMRPPGWAAGSPIAWALDDWEISHCKFENIYIGPIYISGTQDYGSETGVYHKDMVISDVIIDGYGGQALNLKHQDNIRVRDVFIQNADKSHPYSNRICIQFRNSNGIMERVFVDAGEYHDAQLVYLEQTKELWYDGPSVTPTMGVTIQNCIFHDPNDAYSIMTNGGSCYNLLIRNNTFVNPDADDSVPYGINFNAGATGTITGNLFAGSITTAVSATSISDSNTWKGTVAAAYFNEAAGDITIDSDADVDGDDPFADNFQLTGDTPSGTESTDIVNRIASGFPDYDFLGNERPEDQGTHGDVGAYEYQGTPPVLPTGCNFITDAEIWLEFSNNFEDSTENENDFSDPNEPDEITVTGAACYEGVDTGYTTLEDTEADYLVSAALDIITNDFTQYMEFEITENLDNAEYAQFGQWEYGDDERRQCFMIIRPDGQDAGQNHLRGYIGHNNGDGADGDGSSYLDAESEGSPVAMVVNHRYRAVMRYKNSGAEDDFNIHLYDAEDEGNELGTKFDDTFLDANVQYAGNAVEFTLNAAMNSGTASTSRIGIKIYEFAVWNSCLSEANSDLLGAGGYSGLTGGPVELVHVGGNLTSAGFFVVLVSMNRVVASPAINCYPYFDAPFDYPSSVRFSYIQMDGDSDAAIFYGSCLAGARGTFEEAVFSGVSITLPSGCTWVDEQNVPINLSLEGLDAYIGDSVEIPFDINNALVVGTGRTYTTLQLANDASFDWLAGDYIDLNDETHILTGEFDGSVGVTLMDGTVTGADVKAGAIRCVFE